MNKNFFKKSVVLTVIITFFIASITLPVGSSENDFLFEASNIDESTIEIVVNIPSYDFGKTYIGGEFFATIDIEGASFSIIEGQAKLPVFTRMIEIPYGASPKISVREITWETSSLRELRLPERILPVQPSILKIESRERQLVIDNAYYLTNGFMPSEFTRVIDEGEARGRNFVLIEISPVQYNPATGELNLMQNCELIINLNDFDMQQTYEKISRYSSKSFEELFTISFENYGYYEEEIGHLLRDQEGYLIIVYDNFLDEIQPLATWKQSLGFDVTVTTTSSIPGGVSTTTIHNYIEDAYDTWPTPPAYVLLVGDTPQIPTYTGQSSYTATDLYYATMDDTDYFPDIFIGRFPAAQESHVTAMVDKTIYYEQGSFASTDWIKKATFMAGNDNYQISEGTHNYVISNYLEPNGYTCDKLYEVTYGATTQDVRDALNDGRSLAVFSGHGSTTSWSDGPYFSQSDVNGLTNQDIYPFVCSHACVTGKFSNGECFGETWLRAANKAGLAFWGSSANTYWDEDDILEKKMFYAWWVDNLETIGGMTDMALYYLYQHYSGGGRSKYYFECYNVLGDPSVKIWSDEPDLGHILYGYAYYGNLSAPAFGAYTTIINTRTGESLYTFVEPSGYYEANLDDMPSGWLHGDTILINITGTGDYNNWFGDGSLIVDENVQTQQINDIILIEYIEYAFTLYAGWNMLTIPVENEYTAESLGQAIDGCTIVTMFDASTQTFLTHVVGIPHNDFPILDGCGYYIYVNTDSIVTVSGLTIQTASVPLFNGWNMIGWYHDYNTTAESLGQSIDGCTVVCMFDAETQIFTTHVVGVPYNDFFVEIGTAFFIYVTQASTWQGEG